VIGVPAGKRITSIYVGGGVSVPIPRRRPVHVQQYRRRA
jgi:hypothetical protein